MTDDLKLTGDKARERLEALRKAYEEDRKNSSFNALVLGDYGTGKTHLLQTARQPVLIHSFDPGGSKTLADSIKKGGIYVDTSFEPRSEKRKTDTFDRWEKDMQALRRDRVFDTLGTFVIDSGTLWFDELLRGILRTNNIEQMRIQDWGVALNVCKDWVGYCTSLPCDFIMTAHIGIERDEVTGKNETVVLVGGQAKHKLPLYFDEVYVTMANKTSGGLEYKLLTVNDGYYKARTRLGAGGKFDKMETPDIQVLLKKAGWV